MKPPAFWQREGILPALLTPLGWLYDAAGRWRRWRTRPMVSPVPVICVGNLTSGGQGKTPVVLALIELLEGLGRRPAVLSRGYGAQMQGPLRVWPDRHTAAEVGDEPLLLAEAAPTYICPDRTLTAALAYAEGAECLVMDDGFQNPGLAKNFSLIVVDGATGFGNGRVMPAGPLREALAGGLKRADAVVLIGPDRTGVEAQLPPGLPVLRADLLPGPLPPEAMGRPLVAFAGIGRPEKFFDSLRELGVVPVAEESFADHHPYGPADLTRLQALASRHHARLITTAKDALRLPPDVRAEVAVLPVRLVWREPQRLADLLGAIG